MHPNQNKVEPSASNKEEALKALERTPPHNLEAEQALLAALLHNNGVHEQVSEFLEPRFFAHQAHGVIYEAITRLIERGQVADPITLKDYLAQHEDLEGVGGARYLVELASSVISIINVGDYAQQLRDLHIRRQLIQLGQNVVNDAYVFDLDTHASQQIEIAEQKLFELAATGEYDRGFFSFNDALVESLKMAEVAFRRDSHVVGVTTGLKDLDKWLGGLHPSDLIIVAGRPSMGKTALGANIAFNAAKEKNNSGATVAFFSLEMSAEQLATRLLSQESEIPSDKIRRGDLRDEHFAKFVEVSRALNKLPLYIDDTPALTVSALRTRARRLKRQKDLGLIVVDYLQLLQPPPGRNRNDGRVQEISEITRCLKALAKELNVPVIAISQLSRAVEQRDDKRPQLADLRESGSIEQDADVVMFVYREEYYEVRRQPQQEDTEKYYEWRKRYEKVHNIAEVIIAKQRHGPVGTIRLFYERNLIKFSDLAEDKHIPEQSPPAKKIGQSSVA